MTNNLKQELKQLSKELESLKLSILSANSLAQISHFTMLAKAKKKEIEEKEKELKDLEILEFEGLLISPDDLKGLGENGFQQ